VSTVAIDTAARQAAWALLVDDSGAVLESREVPGGELDRRLPGALSSLLAGRPEAVVVLTGPGSYSGVRAGMAAALGLAVALGVPLCGLGNLEAVAAVAAVEPGSVFRALADAGRGGVYVATFASGGGVTTQLTEVERVAAAELDGGMRSFATGRIAGLEVELVDAVRALAAAVAPARARAPLRAAGLAAIHAVSPPATPA
jgi:tRNA threonylcarbamoyladenosine biosynthesis protein TsaB